MALSARHSVAIGTLALVLVTSPAIGGPDARKEPSVSGPLVLERKDCEPAVKSRSENGDVGIVTRKCLWLYQYDSSKESSGGKDYGVAWVQTFFSPKNGWCLKSAESGILNNDRHILKKAPSKGFTIRKKHSGTTKLRATAGGDAEMPAAIKQSLQMLPGRISTKLVQGGRYFKTVWEGATTKPIAFAVGIEVWWDPDKQSTTNAGGSLASQLRRRC